MKKIVHKLLTWRDNIIKLFGLTPYSEFVGAEHTVRQFDRERIERLDRKVGTIRQSINSVDTRQRRTAVELAQLKQDLGYDEENR